jgi:hypothetical protein
MLVDSTVITARLDAEECGFDVDRPPAIVPFSQFCLYLGILITWVVGVRRGYPMSVVMTAACCWRHAAETEVQAAHITDQHLKAIYLRIAHHWSALARSYELADCAQQFLLDAKRAKGAVARQQPNKEIIVPLIAVGQMDLHDQQYRHLITTNDDAYKADGVLGARNARTSSPPKRDGTEGQSVLGY